jgi:DNA-binding phage protein
MTISLKQVMQDLPPQERQQVENRVAELIAEDPVLKDLHERQVTAGSGQQIAQYRTSRYKQYLVASLREPEAAADYLTAILAESEPEPGLFSDALEDVTTALGTSQLQHNVAKLGADRLNIVSELNEYLISLGLQLVVTTHRDGVV